MKHASDARTILCRDKITERSLTETSFNEHGSLSTLVINVLWADERVYFVIFSTKL